jgi:hypothetical protein
MHVVEIAMFSLLRVVAGKRRPVIGSRAGPVGQVELRTGSMLAINGFLICVMPLEC